MTKVIRENEMARSERAEEGGLGGAAGGRDASGVWTETENQHVTHGPKRVLSKKIPHPKSCNLCRAPLPHCTVVTLGIHPTPLFSASSKVNYHKLGGLNDRNVISQHSGGCRPKVKVLVGLVPSEAVRKNLLQASPQLPVEG